MMMWPRAIYFQWPVSSLRISVDISNSSRLPSTKHHKSSRFLSQSRVLDKDLSKSFSNVPIWRDITPTVLWKRLLFSPEIQNIPPGYSLTFRQRNSTARDFLPTPPRPQIAEWIQPVRCFLIALQLLVIPYHDHKSNDCGWVLEKV